jgi:hypothetical protein
MGVWKGISSFYDLSDRTSRRPMTAAERRKTVIAHFAEVESKDRIDNLLASVLGDGDE